MKSSMAWSLLWWVSEMNDSWSEDSRAYCRDRVLVIAQDIIAAGM